MTSFDNEYMRRKQLVTLGMWLFLAALTMLFASSMLGYAIIRLQGGARAADGDVRLPILLWASTAMILASSVTIHRALVSVRRERQRAFRRMLIATCALAIGFIALQAPALAGLLARHEAVRDTGLHVYGLVFFLILLHALHVIGGIAALLRVTVRAFASAYDHESHAPVRHTAMYWHFLDVVWMAMFMILLTVP